MKYTTLFVFALVSLSMAVNTGSFLAKGQPQQDHNPCVAELCLGDNFQNCKRIGEGEYDMYDLKRKGIQNDQVESVRIHGSPYCSVSLFQHADKSGWAVTLLEGQYTCQQLQEHGGKCNDLSYAIVFREEPTPCVAELCLGDNFQNCKRIGEGEYDMYNLKRKGVQNDQVESIRMHGSPYCRVSLFQHADKAGWQVTLPEGEYTCEQFQELGGKCNDLSYAIVFRDSPPPKETPCELTLCQDEDFGRCITVGEGDWKMNDLIAEGMPNDSTSSFITSGQPNCEWQLMQHANYSGWKVTVTDEGEWSCDDLKAMGGKCNDLSSAKVYRK